MRLVVGEKGPKVPSMGVVGGWSARVGVFWGEAAGIGCFWEVGW